MIWKETTEDMEGHIYDDTDLMRIRKETLCTWDLHDGDMESVYARIWKKTDGDMEGDSRGYAMCMFVRVCVWVCGCVMSHGTLKTEIIRAIDLADCFASGICTFYTRTHKFM